MSDVTESAIRPELKLRETVYHWPKIEVVYGVVLKFMYTKATSAANPSGYGLTDTKIRISIYSLVPPAPRFPNKF
jgi:hypothetical protein